MLKQTEPKSDFREGDIWLWGLRPIGFSTVFKTCHQLPPLISSEASKASRHGEINFGRHRSMGEQSYIYIYISMKGKQRI